MASGRSGRHARVQLSELSSALKSPRGPRCASLSGLTIPLMLVISPPATSSAHTPIGRCRPSRRRAPDEGEPPVLRQGVRWAPGAGAEADQLDRCCPPSSVDESTAMQPKRVLFAGPLLYADERTRTSTQLPGHGPEPCASTNSATSACWWACEDIAPRRDGLLRDGTPEPLSGQPARRAGPRPERFASLASVNCAPLSSRGLGRRPLMAETGVRIPVAVP